MSSAIENISYYKEMTRKAEQAWLQAKTQKDRAIIAKQVKTFQRLQLRYHTIASKHIVAKNQLTLL